MNNNRVHEGRASPSGKIYPLPLSELGSHAVKYAQAGHAVFPVHSVTADGGCTCRDPDCRNPGKHPVPKNGSKAATSDRDVIRDWWLKHPQANIAIVPALASGGPMVVLDFDPRNGSEETRAALEAIRGPIRSAVECRTGGGGRHLWFHAPDGVQLRGTLGPGIDVITNGYVVVPPSRHRSGTAYEWAEGRSLLDEDDADFIVRLPSWATDAKGVQVDSPGITPTAEGDVDPLSIIDPTEPETPERFALIKRALKAIDPDGSRADYMTVLRAVDSTGWADVHERITRLWARGDWHGRQAAKYDERTFNRDIKGLRNDKPRKPVTLGSLFKLAEARGWVDPRKNEGGLSAEPAEGVSVVCAADIKPEPIRWAWPGWLAFGKLAIAAGQPGTGKTTIATACAAIISKGGKWPDGTDSPRGDVLIWSGEDDPKDTLVPRLIAAGADLQRVHFVGSASDGLDSRPFDPSRDMPALQAQAVRIGNVRLLIVDPIVSAISGDSHKNAEVRRGLAPLVVFAEAIDAALLGISHFTKGTGGRDPLERVTGSVAFGAVARVVWVTALTESDDGSPTHILARAKSNIGPDDGGFQYTFQQVALVSHPGITASKVEWGAPLVGRARDLLAEREEAKPGQKTQTANAWLQELLAAGPLPTKQVQQQAQEAGHAWRTVERAKVWLGVESKRTGSGNRAPFAWSLPECEEGEGL